MGLEQLLAFWYIIILNKLIAMKVIIDKANLSIRVIISFYSQNKS